MGRSKFRLVTKDGVTLDELIEDSRVEEALAFVEVELVNLENELKYLKKALRKIKKLVEEGRE